MALDFDDGLSPKEAVERIQAYDITPNGWYPTFSDTPEKRKFRLVFFLDTLITNMDARNYLMDSLFEMYPEADAACKNPAHFFYGTNKRGAVLNTDVISLDMLFSVLESDKVKNSGRLRKIAPETSGVAFFRKDGFSRSSYNNIVGATSKATDEHKVEYYDKLKRNKDSKEID